VGRGELCHSRSHMVEAWKWSDKQVRTFLDALEKSGRIARNRGQAFSDDLEKGGQAKGQQDGQAKGQARVVITICKYDEYQFPIPEKGQAEGQAKGQQEGPSKGQAFPKKGPEEEEGLNNKRSIARKRAGVPEGFEEWYSVYAKKVSRKAAERAFSKVIASGDIPMEDLLARTARFSAYWARQPADRQRFKPYPASWLNDAGHFDECDPDGKPWGGPGQPAAPAPVDPATFTNTRWLQCLSLYGRTHQWGEHWGPPPGAAGCFVPVELLPNAGRGNENQPPIFNGAA
jgi:polyhydroxyalkanoate synthesis regulator phasin